LLRDLPILILVHRLKLDDAIAPEQEGERHRDEPTWQSLEGVVPVIVHGDGGAKLILVLDRLKDTTRLIRDELEELVTSFDLRFFWFWTLLNSRRFSTLPRLRPNLEHIDRWLHDLSVLYIKLLY
tara:strand:- start:130 stop:504 length:375 start_codon:yes stop_codon:yes gene_type:complete